MTRLHYILFSLFVVHFGLIGLYMLPEGPLKNSLHSKTVFYVEPLFEQRWHMFAPDPLSFSARAIFKCDGEETWTDPTKDLLEKNAKIPLIHVQKSVFLFNSLSATVIYLRSMFKEKNQCFGAACEVPFKAWIKNENVFTKLKAMASHVCPNNQDKTKIGIYIEHAKAYNSQYQIPNKGIEFLELN